MNGKVELLAPAGNYEGLSGAICAGADAVYLGGNKFGARAYADNFDAESLLQGIDYAHLHGRKIYLTVNTLIKEKEFGGLYDYLAPLYEAGLDGVIIQDVGVLCFIREQFPGLELHASTQMNVTHALGAAFLKEQGVVRVVPARELSLTELIRIKKSVDIELETFIHGAMCYSYSGQCLFSSILGGRSGNRGRCAQPCRLPYKKEKDNWYPLSMKDMCTIEIIPELIEAGIHSFKIEGRMKKPEYAAGVTAIYRKYIDLYYEKGKSGFQVTKEDKRYLQSLYIRSEISEGYYHKHNGKDMITPHNPGYAGSEDEILAKIRNRYIESPLRVATKGEGEFLPGQPAGLTISGGGITVKAEGEVVQQALKQPLTEETILKQLQKSGSTSFTFEELKLHLGADSFLTVKALNELRRKTLDQLKEEILKPYRREILPIKKTHPERENQFTEEPSLHAFVTTKEQWQIVSNGEINRIYIDIDLWKENVGINKTAKTQWYVVLPRIFRLQTETYLQQYLDILSDKRCDGVMVQNLESTQWLQEIGYGGPVVNDASLYIWNKAAGWFWGGKAAECYLPLELNEHEMKDVLKNQKNSCGLQIYGRIPMMVSANCLTRTGDKCRQGEPENRYSMLTDRYGKDFPVYHSCKHCYNIIYNTVPLSLHDGLTQGKLQGIQSLRLDFTTESSQQTEKILSCFKGILLGQREISLPYQEYTTGHFKRGVD